MIVNEEWRNIEGYEGMYQVSSWGRVKSLDRVNQVEKKWIGTIKNLSENNEGYLYVTLFKDGKYKDFFVHRLVAITFLENSYNKPKVNHINGVKTDNSLENLEWSTIQFV